MSMSPFMLQGATHTHTYSSVHLKLLMSVANLCQCTLAPTLLDFDKQTTSMRPLQTLKEVGLCILFRSHSYVCSRSDSCMKDWVHGP